MSVNITKNEEPEIGKTCVLKLSSNICCNIISVYRTFHWCNNSKLLHPPCFTDYVYQYKPGTERWKLYLHKCRNVCVKMCPLLIGHNYASISVRPEGGTHHGAPKFGQIRSFPPSNAWFSDEKQVDIINNPHNPHKVRCSINLYWKGVVWSSVFVEI